MITIQMIHPLLLLYLSNKIHSRNYIMLQSSNSVAANMALLCVLSCASSRTLFPFFNHHLVQFLDTMVGFFISKRVESWHQLRDRRFSEEHFGAVQWQNVRLIMNVILSFIQRRGFSISTTIQTCRMPLGNDPERSPVLDSKMCGITSTTPSQDIVLVKVDSRE